MNANIFSGKIVMSANEAANAGRVGTQEFEELMNLRKAYPDFPISVESKKKSSDGLKGLTYDYMLGYIKNHGKETAEELRTMLFNLMGRDKEGKLVDGKKAYSYGEIKMWFLDQFPEIKKTPKKRDEELDKKLADIKQKRKDKQVEDEKAEHYKHIAA